MTTIYRAAYTLGCLAMLGAFPVWIVAVIANHITTGAVGALVFLFGIVTVLIGAGIHYDQERYGTVEEYTDEDRAAAEATEAQAQEAQLETGRVVSETIKGLNTPKDGWPRP